MTNENTTKDHMKLLFQRPNEPLFTVKGDGKSAFDVPSTFYGERYKTIGAAISTRLGDAVEVIHLRSDISLPNLDFTKSLKIHGPFSLFNRKHQEISGQLIKLFIDLPDPDTLLSTAAYCKDRVNPYLFLVSEIESNMFEKRFLDTKKNVFISSVVCFGSGHPT